MNFRIDANSITYTLDNAGDRILAYGTTVPTDATDGYAKGCLFIDTDVATGTVSVYVNQGTKDSCVFKLINVDTTVTAEIEDLAVTTGKIAADAVDGTKLADDAVSLEHVDDGILPSHVVKYAGEVTWSGGGATLADTVAGVLDTDIVIASFHTLGTEGTILQGAYASAADTITYTLDAANTSNDAVISYQVLRAAA